MEDRSFMIDFRGLGRPAAETECGGCFTIENTPELANGSGRKISIGEGAGQAASAGTPTHPHERRDESSDPLATHARG